MTLVYPKRILQIFIVHFIIVSTVWANTESTSASYHVTGITLNKSEEGQLVTIQGDTPPTYTTYEMVEPLRVVLDIADADFTQNVILPITANKTPINKITGTTLRDQEPGIAKIEILLTDDSHYKVDRKDNNILISFADKKELPAQRVTPAAQVSNIAESSTMPKGEHPSLEEPLSKKAPPISQNSDPVTALLNNIAPKKEGSIEKQIQRAGVKTDKFAAAGYKKQRISVDFYKIELHNVFRLFGEISGVNMIIDQGVSGTLTLALKEVPWDFAMDIILNLQGLQKEERYNTIIISQKNKKFEWPEEPEKALEIKAPETDVKIAIEKRLEMPVEMLEAKKIMHRAKKLEISGNNFKALELYESAFAKWNDNSELARRIASFCLVKLGMNAKALHYAKSALKIDKKDYQAALQAAIAAANMKKPEAGSYFRLATSQERPTKEALISYASYAEQTGEFGVALSALSQYAEIYGDSLETMIARARIYDRNGEKDKATTEYRTILFSGYQLEEDLQRYIKGRVAL